MQNKGFVRGVGASMAAALLLSAATFLLPLLVYGGKGMSAGEAQGTVLPPEPSPVQSEPAPSAAESERPAGEEDRGRAVKVKMAGGEIVEMNMAEYLWGVVAAEMPAAFEPEALKAQAVAARTYTLWKALHNKAHPEANVCTDYNCCQAWISREEAMEKWAEDGPANGDKLDRAVADTDGVVLYYDGQPIQAAFHSSSAGRTQDAVAVWGSTVPYLTAVTTPEGEETPNYHTTASMTAEAVQAALAPLGCKLEDEPEKWLAELTYSENGSVIGAKVGGVELRGNVLRTALGLRSPSFTVEYRDGAFQFSVTGYGHGVGMSQYGAKAMAKEGKTWQEILRWYYTGVEFGDYDGAATPAGPSDPPGTAGG